MTGAGTGSAGVPVAGADVQPGQSFTWPLGHQPAAGRYTMTGVFQPDVTFSGGRGRWVTLRDAAGKTATWLLADNEMVQLHQERQPARAAGTSWRVRVRRLRIAAPYRLRLRRCRHPAYTVEDSRRHRHPDGRPESYERCVRCLRVTWRAWDRWPFNQPRWRAALIRAQGRYRLRRPS